MLQRLEMARDNAVSLAGWLSGISAFVRRSIRLTEPRTDVALSSGIARCERTLIGGTVYASGAKYTVPVRSLPLDPPRERKMNR